MSLLLTLQSSVPLIGTLGITAGGVAEAEVGTESQSGTLDVTSAGVGEAEVGTESIVGVLGVTGAGGALASVGTEQDLGSLNLRASGIGLSAVGSESVTGTIGVTAGGAGVAETGTESQIGTLGVTASGKSLASSSVPPPIIGTFAVGGAGIGASATGTIHKPLPELYVAAENETSLAVTPSNDDNPATEAEANLGFREFYAELASPTVQLDQGLSLTRRIDAISLDYLTAYTLGPIFSGDFSAGPVDRPWKVYAIGNQVYQARLNNARTDFDPPTPLFTFAGPPPEEIDAAFDQAAHILVCMERPTGLGGAPEVWIYFFDPFASAYVLTNFGSGRTPRALLDDTVDSNNADILVFYLKDDTGMCWRQQRDRYLTQYVVPDSIPVVDGGAGTLYGPIVLAYPNGDIPNVQDGSVGSQYIFANAGGVAIQAYAQGIYPFLSIAGTHFQRQWVTIGNPPSPQGLIDIRFDHPISGIEIEAVNALYDNGIMIAYGKTFGEEVGRVYFPKATGLEPRPRRGIWRPTRDIWIVSLLASAADVTSWDNLKIRTDPPVLPPPNDPLLPNLPFANIEDVYKSSDNRVHILLSVHDQVTGTYRFYVKATAIYPLKVDIEAWKMIHAIPQGGGQLVQILKYVVLPGMTDPIGNPPAGFTEIDAWKMTHTNPQSGTLITVLIIYVLYDIDTWQMTHALPTVGSLVPVSGPTLLTHTLFDIDAWKMTHTIPQSGVMTLVVITHSLFDIDSWKMVHAIPVAGGSLT